VGNDGVAVASAGPYQKFVCGIICLYSDLSCFGAGARELIETLKSLRGRKEYPFCQQSSGKLDEEWTIAGTGLGHRILQ